MIPFWKKTGKHSKPQSAQKRRQNAKPAVPRTAQQSIPMQRMFEDGTCRVKPNYYTRTIQYQDINYQLAQQEDRTAIFEEWCSFLNFFDSSIKFELSFVNMATDSTEFEKSIRIPYQRDGFDDVRAEYSQMLRQQLAKGNNGLTKTKFITFGVEGESMAQVKPRLDHIQNDLLNNFHRLGVQAKPLNGAQRLKLMHDMFNMDGASKFHFDWKDLVKSGLSVKDAIAPTAFAFKNSRTFQMGGIFCAASFLSITASDISDQLLKDFLDMDSSQIVTMHIQSVDQNKAIKTIKHTITELDRSKIEEQKKAIRAGYDIDIIPSDLATYGRDAKALLKELQSQNERMFLVTFLVLNTGRTEQELENNVFQASSIAQKHNCNLCRLDFQQEQGLMSSLPLADCQIEIQRGLTTSSTAIFIPFTTQELYQSGKESLYYGLNALSNNLIMVDRKKLKNPNGLILGTPGSGKSFSAKREIANAFLVTDDDIIVNDPEGEYSPLVNRLKGQVIKISPNSTQFINPMDINANYSEEDNPLSLKADFILSLCELVVGGKEGLLPVEKTVIDRCVHLIYRKYFADPCPENMPILEDLYNALLQQDEKEAHHVATALEIYVKGSLNLFNHRTNVNVNNRIVCYDIKELGKQMKKLGMLIVQDQVWGRVTANRSSGKSTRYYMDEMHLLLKEEQTAAYKHEPETLHITETSFPSGSATAIIGHNGAGKSTFARCLCGLEKHFKGTVQDQSKNYSRKERLKLCYMVMQDVNHQLFTESVLDEILLSMRTENKQRAREILKEMDLLSFEDSHPMGLSGGQKQRVAVASAIASERPLILFDEPTSGLDLFHMRQVANVVNQVANAGRTALVVTHDPEFILRCCNYVLHLENGQIQESYSIEDSNGQKRLLKFFLSDMKKEVSTE